MGRELDARVAQEVMGWKPEDANAGYRNVMRGGPGREYSFLEHRPNYTTSIAAAWEVVARMSELTFWRFALDFNGGPHPDPFKWRAMFRKTGDAEWEPEEGTTAPEAICLAALSTISHEKEAT